MFHRKPSGVFPSHPPPIPTHCQSTQMAKYSWKTVGEVCLNPGSTVKERRSSSLSTGGQISCRRRACRRRLRYRQFIVSKWMNMSESDRIMSCTQNLTLMTYIPRVRPSESRIALFLRSISAESAQNISMYASSTDVRTSP